MKGHAAWSLIYDNSDCVTSAACLVILFRAFLSFSFIDDHHKRMQNCNFKIKFSRTTKKSECISVKGPKMWNDIPADIKLCKSMFTLKKMYKALLLQPYQFG